MKGTQEMDFWKDVQALVGKGLVNRRHSAHLLLCIKDLGAFRGWLERDLQSTEPLLATTHDVTGAFDPTVVPTPLYQIGFTPAGLKAMGAPQKVMDGFSEPFLAGMAPTPAEGETETRRAGILGDVGRNHESDWDWGGAHGGVRAADIHILLMLFADTEAELDDWVSKALKPSRGLALACGGDDPKATKAVIYNRLYLTSPQDNHPTEHFGYVDGLSQPMIKGLDRAEKTRLNRPETYRLHAVAAGEFVLGQENERTIVTPYPRHREFGANGSYLVVRQLAQHVGAFNELVKRTADEMQGWSDEDPLELAAAKLMGRFRDGRPLTPMPRENGSYSSFTFADRDSGGLHCPFSSHIRRANPRDSREDNPETALRLSKRHRVMRRGRIYGPVAKNQTFGEKDCDDQGLLFMCVNADIAQQFEFIQQTWLNNTTFAGADAEVDPIVAGLEPSEKRFTIPGRPQSAIVQRHEPLTTLKGGGYFFLPGKRALLLLAQNDW